MIRAIVVDDEWGAISLLSNLLEATGLVEIVGQFTNSVDVLSKINEQRIDIAFLDIEMPGIDGITLANLILDQSSTTEIVFVTAYNEYAVKAFELQAMDYLLKPVTEDRLRTTLNRISVPKNNNTHRSQLKVCCFGKLIVENDHGVRVKWRTNKTEELFAYLLDNNDKEESRDKIINALWTQFEGKQALTNFSTCLYNMRKALADIGFSGLLISSQGMYRLDMEQLSCDFQKFNRCIALIHQINDDNYKDFEEAIEHCSGGYLELNYYEWADNKRRMLEEAYSMLVVQMALYDISKGRHLKAAETLKRGLLQDSLHSELNRTQLELLLLMKDRVAAIRHYETYKRKLDEEFGMKPDEDIVELIRRMG